MNTEVVLMIGEIGGPQEVAAGKFAKENMTKPVSCLYSGFNSTKGKSDGTRGRYRFCLW